MDTLKSPPSMNFDTLTKLIKTDQALPGGKRGNATEPGDDIVAAGAISMRGDRETHGGVEDGARLPESRRRTREAHECAVCTISPTTQRQASVKIIAESMGKWRTTEIEAATEADLGTRRSHKSILRSVHDGKLQHELTGDSNTQLSHRTASKNPCDKAERANVRRTTHGRLRGRRLAAADRAVSRQSSAGSASGTGDCRAVCVVTHPMAKAARNAPAIRSMM